MRLGRKRFGVVAVKNSLLLGLVHRHEQREERVNLRLKLFGRTSHKAR